MPSAEANLMLTAEEEGRRSKYIDQDEIKTDSNLSDLRLFCQELLA